MDRSSNLNVSKTDAGGRSSNGSEALRRQRSTGKQIAANLRYRRRLSIESCDAWGERNATWSRPSRCTAMSREAPGEMPYRPSKRSVASNRIGHASRRSTGQSIAGRRLGVRPRLYDDHSASPSPSLAG